MAKRKRTWPLPKCVRCGRQTSYFGLKQRGGRCIKCIAPTTNGPSQPLANGFAEWAREGVAKGFLVMEVRKHGIELVLNQSSPALAAARGSR